MVRPLQPGDPNYEAAKAYHAKRSSVAETNAVEITDAMVYRGARALNKLWAAQGLSWPWEQLTGEMIGRMLDASRAMLEAALVDC